ncbi:MAG: hypothetical protein JO368_01765 [Acidimicrobiales bacterium]|nr:hypothetical protein [Acidimicrobiales bacterium]
MIPDPPIGRTVLDRLRVPGRPRPAVDPDRSRNLRRRLDDALSSLVRPEGAGPRPAGSGGGRQLAGEGPLVVTKARLNRVLTCPSHIPVDGADGPWPTLALATGAVVDAAFRQLVTVGSIDDPVADGLAALRVGGQEQLLHWVAELPDAEWSRLVSSVEEQAEGLRRRWPPLDPAWLPRTQEPLRVAVAGGAVELFARVDLMIGIPGGETASVALLELKSGVRRPDHRAELRYAALLEALRHPAPPFVSALYYTRTGELDVEWVTDEMLADTADRTIAGVRRLLEEHSGVPSSPLEPALCLACRAVDDGPRPATRGRSAGPVAAAVPEGRAAAAVRAAGGVS